MTTIHPITEPVNVAISALAKTEFDQMSIIQRLPWTLDQAASPCSMAGVE
jgi:hypothetical protein